MKRFIALASLLLATPVNAQSASERKLADVYGQLGSDVGFLLCDAYSMGLRDSDRAFSYLSIRLTEGDSQLLDNVLAMSSDNYYQKIFFYNQLFQMEQTPGCLDWMESLAD